MSRRPLTCMRFERMSQVPKSTKGSTAVAWRTAVERRRVEVGTWEKSLRRSWKLRSSAAGGRTAEVGGGTSGEGGGERVGKREVWVEFRGFVEVL